MLTPRCPAAASSAALASSRSVSVRVAGSYSAAGGRFGSAPGGWPVNTSTMCDSHHAAAAAASGATRPSRVVGNRGRAGAAPGRHLAAQQELRQTHHARGPALVRQVHQRPGQPDDCQRRPVEAHPITNPQHPRPARVHPTSPALTGLVARSGADRRSATSRPDHIR